MRKEGLIDHAAERFAECGRQSIAGHLDEEFHRFHGSEETRSQACADDASTYIERIIDQAHAVRLPDLTLSAVELAVGRIQKTEKLSARAVNAHTTAVKSFVRWAAKDNRIRAHELGSIDRQNEDADRRYVRRPADRG